MDSIKYTPEQIAEHQFSKHRLGRAGYDANEVNDFLNEVIRDQALYRQQVSVLSGQVKELRETNEDLRAKLAAGYGFIEQTDTDRPAVTTTDVIDSDDASREQITPAEMIASETTPVEEAPSSTVDPNQSFINDVFMRFDQKPDEEAIPKTTQVAEPERAEAVSDAPHSVQTFKDQLATSDEPIESFETTTTEIFQAPDATLEEGGIPEHGSEGTYTFNNVESTEEDAKAVTQTNNFVIGSSTTTTSNTERPTSPDFHIDLTGSSKTEEPKEPVESIEPYFASTPTEPTEKATEVKTESIHMNQNDTHTAAAAVSVGHPVETESQTLTPDMPIDSQADMKTVSDLVDEMFKRARSENDQA